MCTAVTHTNVAKNVMAINKCNNMLLGSAYITEAVATEIVEVTKPLKKAMLVDLVETYFKLLKSDNDPAILIVAQDSYAI